MITTQKQALFPNYEFIDRNEKIVYILLVIMIIPSLLINLGMLPFIEDEGIRALVALEMEITGNLITPHLGGELYFNKPPLYNWIILFFFKLTGSHSEFVMRLPAALSLLAFGGIVFHYTKKEFGTRFGIITALLVVTNGRVYFYESLHGLIDTLFSCLTYLSFMLIYNFYKREKWFKLYFYSYIIVAITFLLKGLPSIAFQGITLLTVFIANKNFKKLFHWAHFVSVGIFLVIIGSYYFVYYLENKESLGVLFSTIFNESSKRTASGQGFDKMIKHLFTFPFEFLWFFAPWSVLVIFLFRKNSIQTILKNNFLRYSSLIFITNIIIYWISPQVYGRYLLMFTPLFFSVVLYFYFQYNEQNKIHAKITHYVFFALLVVMGVMAFAMPFHYETKAQPGIWIYTIIFAGLMSICAFLHQKYRKYGFLFVLAAFVIFRIIFDFAIMPSRNRWNYKSVCRASANNIGEKTKNTDLYVFRNDPFEFKEYKKYLNYNTNFYITRKRMKILSSTLDTTQNATFIIHQDSIRNQNYTLYDTLKVPHNKHKVLVVKFSE